ncbi:MAG: hypothetical protein V2B20_08215 [Pseudomonadota bacterium]
MTTAQICDKLLSIIADVRNPLKTSKKMENRNYPRIVTRNLSVDASDGVGFFQGAIANVSRFGLCITDLSKKLDGTVKKMTVIVSEKGRAFKLIVQPQWSKGDGISKSIGVSILNPPLGWTGFVYRQQHLETKRRELDIIPI